MLVLGDSVATGPYSWQATVCGGRLLVAGRYSSRAIVCRKGYLWRATSASSVLSGRARSSPQSKGYFRQMTVKSFGR